MLKQVEIPTGVWIGLKMPASEAMLSALRTGKFQVLRVMEGDNRGKPYPYVEFLEDRFDAQGKAVQVAVRPGFTLSECGIQVLYGTDDKGQIAARVYRATLDDCIETAAECQAKVWAMAAELGRVLDEAGAVRIEL